MTKGIFHAPCWAIKSVAKKEEGGVPRVLVLVFWTTVTCNGQRTLLIFCGTLNTCWPLKSSERSTCFVVLGSTAFVLSVTVSLSQCFDYSFCMFTLLTPFHIPLSGEWMSGWLCWTGANPLQLVVQMWINYLTLMLWVCDQLSASTMHSAICMGYVSPTCMKVVSCWKFTRVSGPVPLHSCKIMCFCTDPPCPSSLLFSENFFV